MQPTRNTPNKKTKFLDTKILIASLAMASTIGLWNLLSNSAVQADKASPTQVVVLPAQPPANEAQGFPPLPTLVPLSDAPYQPTGSSAPAIPAQSSLQTGSLRSVTAPDQAIVQKVKPVIDQPVITISGGGGGRGSGGSGQPAPVTNTGSSKK